MHHLTAFGCAAGVAALLVTGTAHAGTFSTSYGFSGSGDGSVPLTLVPSGKVFYGTTYYGGANGTGSVFKFDPATAKETPIYSFPAGSGSVQAFGTPLIQADVMYGTTSAGGAAGDGLIYKIDLKSGVETDLHSFSGAEGKSPGGALVWYGGLLYGTTEFGTTSDTGGAAFAVDPGTGATTVLHSFDSAIQPYNGLLLYNGLFYGSGAGGSVYSLDPSNGAVNTLHTFSGPDGSFPASNLVVYGGALFGGTYYGGKSDNGVIFKIDLGTGAETTLHKFKGTDGNGSGSLVVSGTSLYGTARQGGSGGNGTVFKMNPGSGATKVLHNFVGTDGNVPLALIKAGKDFYGTTQIGGSTGCTSDYKSDCGTIFEIAP